MNERDALYNIFQNLEEDRKRRKFDAFMDGFEGGLTFDLDKAYSSGDTVRYDRLLRNIKSKGIKVFRNGDGKHKLKFL